MEEDPSPTQTTKSNKTMYSQASPQQQQHPATKKLVTRLLLNLVDGWVSEGLQFPDMTYTGLFHCILPGYSMGTIHAKFIGEALGIIEDIHQVKIETIFPGLPSTRSHGTWNTNQ